MVVYPIGRQKYISFAPEKGHNKCRFNRSAKIAREFNELERKFHSMIDRASTWTLNAQMALGLLLTMNTGIRIGNESSAEGYMTIPHPNSPKEPEFVQTYGLTTLKWEHVLFNRRKQVTLLFSGKKQVENSFELPTQLSEYVLSMYDSFEPDEDSTVFDFTAYELTKFIKRYVGKQYSPKDFRTMRANVVASEAFEKESKVKVTTKTEVNACIKSLATYVSQHLNNTPGVCKKSYIDTRLLQKLLDIKTEQLQSFKTKNKHDKK